MEYPSLKCTGICGLQGASSEALKRSPLLLRQEWTWLSQWQPVLLLRLERTQVRALVFRGAFLVGLMLNYRESEAFWGNLIKYTVEGSMTPRWPVVVCAVRATSKRFSIGVELTSRLHLYSVRVLYTTSPPSTAVKCDTPSIKLCSKLCSKSQCQLLRPVSGTCPHQAKVN
jgi:hypothetical protein